MDFNTAPVTMILIAANVIISLIGFSNTAFFERTIMHPYSVKRNNEYYRFITSGFLHIDQKHLFFNMFTLYFFGTNLEYILTIKNLGGKPTYLLLYFSALVLSDIGSFVKYKNHYNYRTLGASGAVSAVVFAAIIFNPWDLLFIFGIIPLPAIIYAALYIYYCIYMSKRGGDNINHDAHLWGAVFGLVFMASVIGILKPHLFNDIFYALTHPFSKG